MRRALSRVAALAATALLLAPGAAHPATAQDQAEAVFMEAEALLRLGRTDQAREQYQRIIDNYSRRDHPGLIWRAAARVRLADIRWRSTARGAAGAEYVAVLEQEPPSSWSSRARLGLADVALGGGDWLSAVDLLQRVVVAAQSGGPEADAGAADEATSRLTLIYRFRIRAELGEPPWTAVGGLAPAGTTLDRPVGVAASGDGQVLVVDEGLPAVILVDAAHTGASRLAFNEHSRPWWGSDGLPYLPTRRAGVIALGGSRVGFLATEGGRPVPLKALVAGVRTPAGRWYLIDDGPARLLRFGPEGDFQGLANAADDRPVDVSVDPLGRVLYLERETGSVIRLHPDGRLEGTVLTGVWRRPEALAVDGLGNIYVLDRDLRTVDVYNAGGERLARIGPGLPAGNEIRSPRDISVDGTGRLYIADRGASTVWVLR